MTYVLRYEGDDFYENIPNGVEKARKVIEVFRELFDDLVVVNADDQIRAFAKRNKSVRPIISLDPIFNGDYNLGLSRVFKYNAPQRMSMHMTNRPESESIKVQLEYIPDGAYLVVDDDSVTGTTFREVQHLLPNCDLHFDTLNDLKCRDICDVRDFISGAPFGGLVVVKMFNVPVRVPYYDAGVSLVNRASIPVEQVAAFRAKLWEINHED